VRSRNFLKNGHLDVSFANASASRLSPNLSALEKLGILALFVAPRIPIFAQGMSSVRLEDFVLLCFGLAAILGLHQIDNFTMRPFIIFVASSVLSSAFAVLGNRVDLLNSLLSALRPLEYFAVVLFFSTRKIPAGERLSDSISPLLELTTVTQTVFAVAQVAGVHIGYSAFDYSRASGMTNGPYELGAISLLLLFYWFHKKKNILVVLSSVSIVLSASRVSVLGIIFGAAIFAVLSSRRKSQAPLIRKGSKFLLISSIGLLVLVGSLFVSTSLEQFGQGSNAALNRVQSTSLFTAWGQSGVLAEQIPFVENASAYAVIAYEQLANGISGSDLSQDASNLIRFYRWHILLNTISSKFSTLIFGLGPSFPGPSVDGALLRVFIEGGLVGIFCFLFTIRSWFRGSEPWFVAATTSLLIGGIFIDTFYSMRIMIIFWTLFFIQWEDRNARFGNNQSKFGYE
jgi:hypothetical protein